LRDKHTDFVQGFRKAVCEGNVRSIIVWFYIMLQYWVPADLVGATFALAELGTRLPAAHLAGLVTLWVAAAGAVSWGVWWAEKLPTSERT